MPPAKTATIIKKASPPAKLADAARKPAAPKTTAPTKQAAGPVAKAVPVKGAPQVTVTLKQIAAELAEGHDLPNKRAEEILADLVALTTRHLKQGDKIRLTGLGSLEVRARPARTGRNPATGASIEIAASKKIAFRPSKELKEAV